MRRTMDLHVVGAFDWIGGASGGDLGLDVKYEWIRGIYLCSEREK